MDGSVLRKFRKAYKALEQMGSMEENTSTKKIRRYTQKRCEYRTEIDGLPMIHEVVTNEPYTDVFGDLVKMGTTVLILSSDKQQPLYRMPAHSNLRRCATRR